ncbi:type I restriction endonuclease [Pseudomonas aeruginosa]|uniref:type I restriction endonuclease n=1 Tax=Pseudomonas aeruginosa TaxID=287 RepID=UPI001C69942E|nr:type I restriction endonuclease [Pseudomonas aeruginosa]
MMKFETPELKDLKNESDVEQKLIFPLVCSPAPYGLSHPQQHILTKQNIKSLEINKGRQTKSYFPDYLITSRGYPLIVIEAKAPGEDLNEAYREARLYAQEINALYPSGINPCSLIIACNGEKIIAGASDSFEPSFSIPLNNINPSNSEFSKFCETFNSSATEIFCDRFDAKIKPEYLKKPRRLVGGKSVQNEEVGHNSFGATIAAELGHIFNPNTIEDRIYIVKNGYIPSKRRERYIDPIDKIIRASKPPSELNSSLIEDTANPKEIIQALSRGKNLEHKVILLVGSVGSGKTTFIDYLREVALPRDIIETSLWIRINMNESPVASDEIYNWLRVQIAEGCKKETPDLDFEELEIIKKLYAPEVNKFEKSIGRLLKGTPEYNIKLAELIERLESDIHSTAIAFTRFCGSERGKLPIIVLDNCDKRTLNEQLLMFQAAQWLQSEFKALVILPLREETYDNHRERPPLDTALKDLVFRIEPPMFQTVLVKRVQLALREMSRGQNGSLRYDLPNGYTVEYSKTDTSLYLMSILRSIFEHDIYIRRIIVGLSARNIRRAMEIFLEFCTSGHIKEDQIFKIRKSEGRYALPLHQVSRVLLRMNRRYYDSDASYVKNIFSTTQFDARTNYFSRFLILRWLKSRFHQYGSSSVKGYFKISDIKSSISIYGFDDAIITRDIEYLLSSHCLVSEDFRVDQLADDDLVKIAPAGFVHLDLLRNITYLAALAEDTLFSDESTAKRIAHRIVDLEHQYDAHIAYENAKDLVDYLHSERQRQSQLSEAFLRRSEFMELTDIGEMELALRDFLANSATPIWQKIEELYPIGSIHTGCIRNIHYKYGVFVTLHQEVTGLVHKSRLKNLSEVKTSLKEGDDITVRIESTNMLRKKIELSIVENM